jgi:hypothetical protein
VRLGLEYLEGRTLLDQTPFAPVTPIAPNSTVSAEIHRPGDTDHFQLTLTDDLTRASAKGTNQLATAAE